MIRSKVRIRMALLTLSSTLALAPVVQAEDMTRGQQPPTQAPRPATQEGQSSETATEATPPAERSSTTFSKDCDQDRTSFTASWVRRLTGRPSPGPGQCPPEEAGGMNRITE